MSTVTAAVHGRVGREMLVSGNWKMNHQHYEAIHFVQKLAAIVRARPFPLGRAASLHPSFTSLRSVQAAVESDGVPVALGAQDCHQAPAGAFTGEVSAEMLAKLNVAYVIVGHSERRSQFGETDEIVRAKVDAVVSHAMTPILCVGESLDERESGGAFEKVTGQLAAAMSGRAAEAAAGMVVAYEPIWAIGTGRNAGPAEAEEMAAHVRSEIRRLCGSTAGEGVRIQYGGSVTPDNAAELLACANVDGFLVGGASLEADGFAEIVRAGA
ncbi:MAG: triose-phosphate isomerase [Acidimicrobiales bacterium]